MVKVGIVGATGYVGGELIRLLASHPQCEIAYLVSESYQGKGIDEVFPHLHNFSHLVCQSLDIEALAKACDLVFLALPHGVSMDLVAKLLEKGKKVIDLGADYRLDDLAVYEKWYGKHTQSHLFSQAVYGLCELNREKIKATNLIGNPGCYPTTALLGLAPLLKHKLIENTTIIIDSKSGVSGAGRGLNLATHFPECNESTKAYNVGKHRHKPEIEQELSKLAGEKVKIVFTPHLVPMIRGMLSTIYVTPKERVTFPEIYKTYQEFYQEEFFVRVLPLGKLPETKFVSGSNYCDLGLSYDEEVNQIIITSAIDNLIKGAAGQAVQNMNILYGWEESKGLDYPPIYP